MTGLRNQLMALLSSKHDAIKDVDSGDKVFTKQFHDSVEHASRELGLNVEAVL